MPIIKMDKLTVVGLASEKDAVIQALMNLGAVEINEDKAADETPVLFDNIRKEDGKDLEIEQAEEWMSKTKNAIELSMKFYKEKKPMFSMKRKISAEIYTEQIGKIDEILDKADKLQSIVTEIANLNAKITRLSILSDNLSPWKNVWLDLSKLETRTTRMILGTVSDTLQYDKLQDLLKSEALDFHTEVLNKIDDSMQLAIIIWKDHEEKARQMLKTINFFPLSIPDLKGTPQELCDRYESEIAGLHSRIAELEAQCAEISGNIHSFEIIYDHAMILLQKAISMTLLNKTRYTFILHGWVPSHLSSFVEKGLQKEFSIAYYHESATNQDDYPILLKNHPLIKPYEIITDMFSVPSAKDIDPNPIMAPFFLLFFSLMLSDAGYGLLLAAGCAFLLWKVKVQGNMRSICLFMFQGGLVSIIWGLMFGGFFGDMLTTLSSGKYSFPVLWFNPINDPIKLMILSMIFGLLHIFSGMGIKAFILIITGKWADAVFDIFSWYLILIGLCGILAGSALHMPFAGTIGKIFVAVGGLTVVIFSGRGNKNIVMRIFKGIASLYDVTAYFSDILSYTRILALSLATGVIAMVVNMLGGILGFNFVGIVLFIVAGLFGHALNLALSTLGCYVHTCRLQYVEFFGKFYEGGGRMWNPLAVRTKYTQVRLVNTK
ncbi:MAG: V-type ATP synthase subunit I [Saccharofermentanales bacterium]